MVGLVGRSQAASTGSVSWRSWLHGGRNRNSNGPFGCRAPTGGGSKPYLRQHCNSENTVLYIGVHRSFPASKIGDPLLGATVPDV